MIKAIRSNQKTFKKVQFKPGFNVVLADRIAESSDKDSRNGLGKSTLLEIIHFCLGASTKQNEGLKIPQLEGWTFILDIILKEKDFSISRNTTESGFVQIEGDFSDWPIKPEYDKDKDIFIMKIKEWNLLLGYLMFNISIKELEKYKYHPSFRSLICYFIRRGVGAFNDPFKEYPSQHEWDIQVNNAYLLGLNWEYAGDFQLLKDKVKLLESLKKAGNQGILQEYTGSIGELEAEKVRLTDALRQLEEQLKTFKVHPEYYKIQEDANTITDEIHKVTNKYSLNEQILNKYKKNVEEEHDVSIERVQKIYEETGLIFPSQLSKKLTEVKEFHKKIVENRKEYLHSEIQRLIREIDDDKAKISELSNKRATQLEVLQTHGALDEYSKLQQRKSSLEQQLESTKKRIEDLHRIEEFRSEINIQKEELLKKTRRDFQERAEAIEFAMSQFNKNSEALYSESGTLSVDITETGYKFNVDIKRAKSQGVNYMKIFCYDLTLIQLHPNLPGLVIHDSTIFDGVDERQIAKALELAAFESEQKGFQYICTLNSDIVPESEFSDKFKKKFKEAIAITLTDGKEDSGLLGLRY